MVVKNSVNTVKVCKKVSEDYTMKETDLIKKLSNSLQNTVSQETGKPQSIWDITKDQVFHILKKLFE